MSKLIIKNAKIVNEGTITASDIEIRDKIIYKIDNSISVGNADVMDANGMYVIPGIIDDQVHFREPGLTYKADIASESAAAIMGGVTSFMEMPNTKPSALTQSLLEAKYEIAHNTAFCNYSFFMGASNDNLEEVLKTNPLDVCGVKVFMGSSTGNMLVDNKTTLKNIFSRVDTLIATHCEDEQTIKNNLQLYKEQFGDQISAKDHPFIRSEEACYLSSSLAVSLAREYNARLHILHISTAKELDLFRNDIPLKEKRITSELCVHHLYFDAEHYKEKGNLIKCNPAIKEKFNREALLQGLLDDRLDIIATDHAPHTWEEKQADYLKAPSGLPLVQHGINLMLSFYHRNEITLERIVEKMCHAPADCFQMVKRGYIKEGYFADLAILDIDKEWTVNKGNIKYKCGWSPIENHSFKGKVLTTIVNGTPVYSEDKIVGPGYGERLLFDR